MTRSHKQETPLMSVESPAAPDGGFGWVVVAAAFMQHVISLGISYTLGVYYPYFIDAFHVLPSTAAWVAALNLGVLFGIGPVAGWLMGKIGTSGVSFAGSLIAGLGCISAAFASSFYVVIVCLGFICGMGTGFMFISAVTAVSRWFDKKRALATGLAVSGAGFGIFLFAPLIRLLLSQYEREGALLIEGGLALQGCVFALLLRPIPRKKCRSGGIQMGSVPFQRPTTNGSSSSPLDDEVIPLKKQHQINSVDKTELTESASHDQPEGYTMKKVLCSWIFWIFAVNQFLTFLSSSGPLVFLYNRTVNDLCVELMLAAFVISMMGIANTAGRLIFGALGNVFPQSRLFLLSGAIMTYGLATALSTLGTSFWSVALYAIVFGAGYGCMFALTTVVLVDQFGIDLFSLVYGNIGLFRGVACLIGPPFGGWLILETGNNHTTLFIIKGILGFIGGALLFMIPVVKHLQSRQRNVRD